MKVGLAADHAGYQMKDFLIGALEAMGFEVVNFGTDSCDSVDYPDYAHPLALAVEAKKVDFGVIICGSGNGVNMAVNKHQGIRGALCWTVEVAKLARQHNDANICALPARFISTIEALAIVELFLSTAFEGGRHEQRVKKISC